MHSVFKGKIAFGDEEQEVFYRRIREGNVSLQSIAGTTGLVRDEERNDKTRSHFSLVCYGGDITFSPVVDNDGQGVGFAVNASGIEALDALEKAVKFAARVLDEERRGLDD